MSPAPSSRCLAGSTLGAFAFAWAVWTVLLAIVLYYFITSTNSLPNTEDWQLVPAITGHEPQFAKWLWAQNNEHRVPLPRLILYLVLRAGKANFRAGMLCNIALLALVSAAMILAARRVRGGRSRYTDAFFPLAALHVGHWENIYWSWSLTFTLTIFFALGILYVFATDPEIVRWRSAIIAGLSLPALPLCGGTGLLFVPLPAAWTSYLGWRALRSRARRGIGSFLLACAAAALVLCAVYFLGYQRPDWTILPASASERLLAVAKVLTFGFGAATRSLWAIFIPLTFAILIWTGVETARGLLLQHDTGRIRALGIAVFLATGVGYGIALGWGRAGVVRDVYLTWPTRYMLLIVPLFYAIYLAWEVIGTIRQRAVMQFTLFAAALLLLPLNTAHGLLAGKWYSDGWQSVVKDANSKLPDFARRHREFLNHVATVEELSGLIRMLKEFGRWPFNTLWDDPAASASTRIPVAARPTTAFFERSIRYNLVGASDVVLVWGIDGWQPLPDGLPPGTSLEGGNMRTPMSGSSGHFSVSLPVPPKATMEFGFLVRDRIRRPGAPPVWEGAPGFQSKSPGAIDITSRLRFGDDGVFVVIDGSPVRRTVHYRSTRASEVYLVWGIDGWLPVPPQQRPAGTQIRMNLMNTPMTRRDDVFEANIATPPSVKVDCGFLITSRQGVSNLLGPVWDAACSDTGSVDINGVAQASLGPEYLPYLPSVRTYMIVAAAVVLLWCVFLVCCYLASPQVHKDSEGFPKIDW
jgi:hypothetical protein